MKPLSYLIFTDLDGTLIDHYSYQADPALPLLRKLVADGHMVIPNTSKTKPEIQTFTQSIGLHSPFIVENGAAIYLPKSVWPNAIEGFEVESDVWRLCLTEKRQHWLELLQQANSFHSHFTGFSQMSVQDIADLTGLSLESATLASQREFGEPLHWHGDKEVLQEFETLMSSLGANVLHGGRFVHVCGKTDKGEALSKLLICYQQQYPEKQFKTIALGDGNNDTAMLEQADIAIQIKSPVHPFPEINKKENLYQSTLEGPLGWAETLNQLIYQTPLGARSHG